MEKRIGTAIIVIEDPTHVPGLNKILSDHSEVILGRQGIPLRDKGINVISLVLEGTTNDLGSLTGRLGKLPGIKVKSVLAT